MTNRARPLNVHIRVPRTDGGRQDAHCADCDWTHRGGTYVGHGDDKRPAGGLTAVVDAACAHIAATDHRVNVELTTWVGGTEQRGTTLIGPGS